eukprot:scaffold594_cov116-Isochrysis_galbana.AAC.6
MKGATAGMYAVGGGVHGLKRRLKCTTAGMRYTAKVTIAWSRRPLTRAPLLRAASASAPNDIVMDIHSSPKRPRDPAQGNMVSQRATPNASVTPLRF